MTKKTVVAPLALDSTDNDTSDKNKVILTALQDIELMVQHTSPEVRATVCNEVKKIREAL